MAANLDMVRLQLEKSEANSVEFKSRLEKSEAKAEEMESRLQNSEATSKEFTKSAIGYKFIGLVQTVHNLEGRLMSKFLPVDFVAGLKEKRFYIIMPQQLNSTEIADFFKLPSVCDLMTIIDSPNFIALRTIRHLAAHAGIADDFTVFDASSEYLNRNSGSLPPPFPEFCVQLDQFATEIKDFIYILDLFT